MKVLFDHQTFTLQEYGGISRYFFELYNRFNQIDHLSETPLIFSNNAYLNANNSEKVKSFFPGKKFKGKLRLQETINRYNSISKLKEGDFDVFHPTYYNPYFLKHLKGKPFVLTFHDMIHEKFKNQYPELNEDKHIFHYKKQLLNAANKIIAVSETTKKDIIEIFGVSEEIIEVIYHGCSIDEVKQLKNSDAVIVGKYLLFVGNRSLYKNFDFYLESVSDVLKKEKVKMVCAGGGKFSVKEIEHIKKLGLKDLVQFYAINVELLHNLYTHSTAFVFPSLYEGFGIPVLEAFSCKTPCLLSRGGSLEEVGGNAALYFNANDAEEIRDKLKLLLSDINLANNLIAKGTERLKEFTWDRTFHKTLEVYKSVI
jgi:glycosyltransferase involved in cell wall biosynthesis